MTNNVVTKIAGIIICLIGIAVWYVDYLVFSAIGALCGYLSSVVGITGEASVGVMIIGWFIGLGLMLGIFAIGALIGYIGMKLYSDGW